MTGPRFLPKALSTEELADIQLSGLRWTVDHALAGSPFYAARLAEAGVEPGGVTAVSDLGSLPLTTAADLQEGYPLPLLSVPETEVVRIHASSGTTGKRKVLAYTARDVETWKLLMARCFEMAGLDAADRVQICVGYGLWTAGAGFQLGCEHFGAMAVPVGPGQLDIQLELLQDLGTTTLCSTASMAVLLGEEVEKQGLADRISLERCIFGAEPHSARQRQRFQDKLGLKESFDITGMTELYGPGAGLECRAHDGIHYWADHYILEILDPATLEPVAPGEVGEMVVTTLSKEASPLIRYRTRDLTRLIPGDCACRTPLPRHDRILGRSDDMFIIRGVNIYPGQIAACLEAFPELGSEYQIRLFTMDGRDNMSVRVERAARTLDTDAPTLAAAAAHALRAALLVRCHVEIVDPGELPRTFSKTRRLVDERGGR